MLDGQLTVLRITTPAEFHSVTRNQKQCVQAAAAMQLATSVLLEKALDSNLDEEAHALVNAANFQVNELKNTLGKLMQQLDSVTLEDFRHD
ncbi:hypothetical protein [Enterovibrio norvegicus]|uniref:hypothetical protein n=1 Tax=Enterovibrio norvegicus TaxID=188144 RepID=UPI000C865080|nr:hypothetical protein [Enterovibrio norvegicus]PMN73180.1 hypothetical protein BCT27_12620 [Enterovibrio norvegicus]